MSKVRLYGLAYPKNKISVCATDEENLILHPKHTSKHKLMAYGGEDIFDFDDQESELPIGSKAIMMRLSHVESRQLILPDESSIATVRTVSTISREEYDSVYSDQKAISDARAEAETKIKSVTVRKMTELRRKFKEEEQRAIDELDSVPSLDDMLKSRLRTVEQPQEPGPPAPELET